MFFLNGGVKMIKLTNKMIIGYLSDCLGYDEMMIDEIKEDYKGCLGDCLNEKEKKDCLNYWE